MTRIALVLASMFLVSAALAQGQRPRAELWVRYKAVACNTLKSAKVFIEEMSKDEPFKDAVTATNSRLEDFACMWYDITQPVRILKRHPRRSSYTHRFGMFEVKTKANEWTVTLYVVVMRPQIHV